MLQLKIEGSWEPQDFIEVLQAVESMYYKLSATESSRYRREPYYGLEYDLFERASFLGLPFLNELHLINQRSVERARYSASPFERLKVRRIQYASLGGIDLMGIGKVCEVITNSIGRLIVYWDDAHIRRERDAQATIETDIKRESLQALKISNAKEALNLLERFHDRQDVLVQLLVRDQDALSTRISEGKLIGASTKESEETGHD